MARILVVDDSSSLRLVLVESLRDEGYAVHQASDGLAALNYIQTAPPDLVLSDLRMPRLDGLSLLRQARHLVPVSRWIFMSATVHRPAHLSAPFLQKPFDMAVLLSLVRVSLAQ